MEINILLLGVLVGIVIIVVGVYLFIYHKQKDKVLAKNKIKLEKLHNTAFKMNKIEDKEEIYELIVEATTDILEFTLCNLALVEAGYFKLKAATEETETESIKITEGIAGKTYQQQETFIVNNVQQNSDARPADESYKAVISAPFGERGIFQVVSTERNRFSQEDVKLVELLLSHALEAIKRIDSQKEIKYISFHDSLTGLYNRAYIEEEMTRLDTARQLPVSIIMIDVNKLKLVNDAFGHKQGDELLVKVAEILKSSCRKEDIVARLGGDEFIIFLPQTPKDKAEKIVERIQKKCKAVNDLAIPLSMAIGVAVKKELDQDIWDIYKRADKKMYKNKLAQRDKIKDNILKTLHSRLEEESNQVVKHNFRLQILAYKLAEEINLSSNKLEKLFALITLHDIGVVALSEEEMKDHSKVGYQIFSAIKELNYLSDDVLHHHEYWNGSGYPDGLAGKEIPLLARILSLIDTYDLLIHGREKNEATVNKKEAKEKLKELSGEKLDPELVKAFLKVI